MKFVISDLLELELTLAPQHVGELLLRYSADRFERVELTQETLDMADKYISERVRPAHDTLYTAWPDARYINANTIQN